MNMVVMLMWHQVVLDPAPVRECGVARTARRTQSRSRRDWRADLDQRLISSVPAGPQFAAVLGGTDGQTPPRSGHSTGRKARASPGGLVLK